MRKLLLLCFAMTGGNLPLRAEVISFSMTSTEFSLVEPGPKSVAPEISSVQADLISGGSTNGIAATLAPAWLRSNRYFPAKICKKMLPAFPGASHSSAQRREIFRAMVEEAACKAGIPVDLLDALIMQESRYRPNAKSHAGAIGLAQLMPGTARDLGVSDPLDPRQNVFAGARYLRAQYDAFGTIPLALAAYNAGPGAVRKHGGIPPFRETRGYVQTIVTSLKSFGTRFRRDPQVVTF